MHAAVIYKRFSTVSLSLRVLTVIATVLANAIKLDDTKTNAHNTLSGVANDVKVNDVAHDSHAKVAFSGPLSRRKAVDAASRRHLTRFARRNENKAVGTETNQNHAKDQPLAPKSNPLVLDKDVDEEIIDEEEEEVKEESDPVDSREASEVEAGRTGTGKRNRHPIPGKPRT
ncbi:hypothetical protein MBANPS3_005949 [Mucor bainieri]